MGRSSTVETNATEEELLLVCSITNSKTEKFLIHTPSCKKTLDKMIDCINLLLKNINSLLYLYQIIGNTYRFIVSRIFHYFSIYIKYLL
ncbi:hypothetical protein SDC9_169103 [bioreactor metagenome]|uniref:Uncharacterized protein n=1 Tax=bioreactor metagenome TaxID=1076179 RepID=A0A645GD07_9ZZZZ